MRRWGHTPAGAPIAEGREFCTPSLRLDADSSVERCVFRVAGEGVHHGYRRRQGGAVVASALAAGPGLDETGAPVAELLDPAMVAARAAAAATATAESARRTQALQTVRNQVARVKASGPPASWSDTDRWLMALSFLLLKEE